MDVVGEKTLEVMSKAKWYNRWLFDRVEKYLGGNILEVGGGIGNFSQMLAKKGDVTAIEINNSYIRQGKGLKGITYGLGNIEKGEYFRNLNNFDSVVCFNVLEHIKNDKKALQNMHQVLKKGGYVNLIVPAHQTLFSHFDQQLGHYRRYSVKSLESKLKKAGFTVVKIMYLNWWAAVGWWIFIKIVRAKKMPASPVGIFDTFGKFFLWPEKIIAPPFGLSVFAVAKK